MGLMNGCGKWMELYKEAGSEKEGCGLWKATLVLASKQGGKLGLARGRHSSREGGGKSQVGQQSESRRHKWMQSRPSPGHLPLRCFHATAVIINFTSNVIWGIKWKNITEKLKQCSTSKMEAKAQMNAIRAEPRTFAAFMQPLWLSILQGMSSKESQGEKSPKCLSRSAAKSRRRHKWIRSGIQTHRQGLLGREGWWWIWISLQRVFLESGGSHFFPCLYFLCNKNWFSYSSRGGGELV